MNERRGVRARGRLLTLILLVGLSLSACQRQEEMLPPVGNHPEIATEFVEELRDLDFESATEKFNQEMRRAMPKELLSKTWSDLQVQVGDYKDIILLREERIQGYDVIFVTTEFDDATIDIRVVFDEDRWIAGLFFEPAREGKKDEDSIPEYVDQERFQEKDVYFGEEPWVISGTLTIPRGEGPFPALVLVHGSGPNDRDETIGPNKPFKNLAEGLSSKGIAVLRYDKRTYTYQREIAEELEDFTVWEETLEDALEGIAFLKDKKDIDEKEIYLLGHSLGGMLAPRIATKTEDLKGLIFLAAPSRSLEELILMQMEYLIEHESEEAEDMAMQLDNIKEQVNNIQDPELSLDTPPEKLLGVYPTYWLDLRSYSPIDQAKELTLPMIFLQGERDYQVTMEDFNIWKKALSDKEDVTFISYEALNHLFLSGDGKSLPEEYMVPKFVEEEVINDLSEWIKKGKSY